MSTARGPRDGTQDRLGAFLINLLYQCDVIICATFITGQASNIIIAKLAKESAGIELTYLGWFAAAIVRLSYHLRSSRV